MPDLPSPIIAVATWSNDILLYTLDQLRSAVPEVTTISEQFFATSLLLKKSTVTSSPTSGAQLVAGLSDGSMIIHDIEIPGDAGNLIVKGRKASSLGSRPLRLCSTMSATKGEEKIIAVGLSERMSVIFEARDRIDFSSVSKKAGTIPLIGTHTAYRPQDITAVASIHSQSLGECLILANANSLCFAKVNSLKKLQVQTLDLNETSVGKLVSLSEHSLLGVGATNRTMDPQTGDVLQSGRFELRDQTSLKCMSYLSNDCCH